MEEDGARRGFILREHRFVGDSFSEFPPLSIPRGYFPLSLALSLFP